VIESSLQLQKITIESAFSEEEGNTGITIPVAVTYAPGDEASFIGDIPLTVTVNGKQTSVSSGYMGYYYETGTTSSDIRIGFDFDIEGSEILYITNYDTDNDNYSVPKGRYEISLTFPAMNMTENQEKVISCVLTVVCNKHTGGTEIRDAREATATSIGYTGDTYCLGCSTKIADGEFIKLQSKISYTASEYSSEFDYTGAVQSVTIDQSAVSVMDTNDNILIENPVLTTDYTIVYKIDGVEKEPVLPGMYGVYLKASATDFWTESEAEIGYLTISSYEPAILFTPTKFEYTQGTDAVTASGTIEVEVAGAEGGLVPAGTVTVTAKDMEANEIIIASGKQLENGKAIITFSDVEPEKLYYFSFNYTPASEEPYTEASGHYEAKYITIGSGESTNYTLNGITKEQLYFVPGQEIAVNAGTKEGYSFKEWSINSEKEIVMSEGNISTSIVKFTMPNVDVSLTATWKQLSSDTSLQSVFVSDVAGEITGNTIKVVLPYTTETLPTDTGAISIEPADVYASVKDLKTEDEGKTWTFTVEAEDKTTQLYTINVFVAEIPVYTVTYTDGSPGTEIFPDQVYEVKAGTATPPFVGTLIHSEYAFMGWNTAILDTVVGDITYRAVWRTHDWSNEWTNNDTHHWHECNNTDPACPITEKSQKIGYGAHTGGTATCKDKAVCEVCKVAYGEVNRTNHTGGTEIKNAKEATTTETGYTGDTYCLGCGEKIASGEVIPVIVNTPTPTVTPKPTSKPTPMPTAKPTATPTPMPTAIPTPPPASRAEIEACLYNGEYYALANEDVAVALDYDPDKLYEHWVNFGKAEGRSASLVFDAKYYLEVNPDVAELVGEDYVAAYEHFVNYGLAEGRESSPVFDVKYYLRANADVAEAFAYNYVKAANHFNTNALAEGRSGSGNFDYTVYRYCNTDVAELYGDEIRGYYIHYINHGRAEGRTAGFGTKEEVVIDTNAVSYRIFDKDYYLENYPVLARTVGTTEEALYRYWISEGIELGHVASPVFDPAEYLRINTDVAGAVGNDLTAATNHFLNYGIYEGRTGVPEFDYTVYKYCNTDVVEVFGDDIVGYYFHYVKYGRAEGRTAKLR